MIRLQSVANLGWEWRNWAANLFWRYQSGYVDQNLNIPRSSPFFNTVESYRTFDLSATWRGTKGLTVRFGVLNLFDTDPPFTNQLANFQSRGYDDNFHNPRGRTYRLGPVMSSNDVRAAWQAPAAHCCGCAAWPMARDSAITGTMPAATMVSAGNADSPSRSSAASW